MFKCTLFLYLFAGSIPSIFLFYSVKAIVTAEYSGWNQTAKQ